MPTDWRQRLEISDLHHGDPCIQGTRIPVPTIIGSLADGIAVEESREAYPQFTAEDISAAVASAAEVLKDGVLIPLSARCASRWTNTSRAPSFRQRTIRGATKRTYGLGEFGYHNNAGRHDITCR